MDKNKKLYITAFIASLFGILCFVALILSARFLLISPPGISWQGFPAIIGLILGMLLLVVIMVFGWTLVLNRTTNKKNQINFVKNLFISKDKWLPTVLFAGSIFCALYFTFLAVSSWRIMYGYIGTVESLRFQFALLAFIGSIFSATVGIIGCILHFVRDKNKNQSSLVED